MSWKLMAGYQVEPHFTIRKRNKAILIKPNRLLVHRKTYKRLCKSKNVSAIIRKLRILWIVGTPDLSMNFIRERFTTKDNFDEARYLGYWDVGLYEKD